MTHLKMTMGVAVAAFGLIPCVDMPRNHEIGEAKGKPPQRVVRPKTEKKMNPSQEAEDLTRVIEDKNLDVETRCQAARKLGKLNARAMVPRLLKLLPGEGDALTRAIIVALGEIGDSRALPILEKIANDKNLNFHKKIYGSLEDAIQQCRKDPS
jgi:hypothetical protein